MKINAKEGFRRICILWSALSALLIIYYGASAIWNREYMRDFYYYSSRSPSFGDQNYSAYRNLEDRLSADVRDRYLSKDLARVFLERAIADGNYSYKPNKEIRVHLLRAIDWNQIFWAMIGSAVFIFFPWMLLWVAAYIIVGFRADAGGSSRQIPSGLEIMVLVKSWVRNVRGSSYFKIATRILLILLIGIFAREGIGPRLGRYSQSEDAPVGQTRAELARQELERRKSAPQTTTSLKPVTIIFSGTVDTVNSNALPYPTIILRDKYGVTKEIMVFPETYIARDSEVLSLANIGIGDAVTAEYTYDNATERRMANSIKKLN